jgi:hypothetical protein
MDPWPVPSAFLLHRPSYFWHNECLPSDDQFTLRQLDQARSDFAVIETELEPIHARLARMPMARSCLMAILGTACLVQTLAFLFR